MKTTSFLIFLSSLFVSHSAETKSVTFDDKTENTYSNVTVIKIEKDGKYEFATESDDGSRLFIEGKEVVNNGGVHPVQLAKGNVELKAGDHKLVLEFFQGGGGAACVLGWTVPGGKRENIPAKALWHAIICGLPALMPSHAAF